MALAGTLKAIDIEAVGSYLRIVEPDGSDQYFPPKIYVRVATGIEPEKNLPYLRFLSKQDHCDIYFENVAYRPPVTLSSLRLAVKEALGEIK